ncbi:MAG: plasmid replication protein, CyRepA1 family [Oscillatoria sp. PMC 1051.18]|nr:plasmid replication protein, CyRepA1 family [Oscillatoria sp. PMC 1051.18]
MRGFFDGKILQIRDFYGNNYQAIAQEWQASAVDRQIVSLNVKYLRGDTAKEYLLYNLPEREWRRNNGTLRSKWQKKYAHTESGGWWCGTVDVLAAASGIDKDSLWGCFKPSKPRLTGSGTLQKPLKYEHPPQAATEIFALRVSDKIWDDFAKHYQICRLGYRNFWHWVIENPEIPIVVTEGAKKAASLLSAGYVAIALPGIYNGYRQPKDSDNRRIGLPSLIPQLGVFAVSNRTIYFAFDQDVKRKAIKNVQIALKKTSKLLINRGCAVKIIRWSNNFKGVDDLLVNQGQESFATAYNSALDFDFWNALIRRKLTYTPDLEINQPYLQDIHNFIPANTKIVAIKSAKGTGKTEAIAQLCYQAQKLGQKTLVLTHRIQLGEALCARFGVDYITQLKLSETQGIFGYGLCVDSLHPNSQANFNPEAWQDAIVIIDEVEQVLWHMLHSSTCQHNRVAILQSFESLIARVLASETGKVVISDADLTDISLDYLTSLGNEISPFVILNNYQPQTWQIYHYEEATPAGLVNNLVKAIARGEKVFICCSAQKQKSKWGTQNLAAYLKDKFPDRAILRIDSESTTDPQNPAFGIMTKLNKELVKYDIVITSPAIETGVSIDLKHHFNSVWGIGQGVQTCDSFRQALSRIRQAIPRHLWVAKKGLSKVGGGEVTPQGLVASQRKQTKLNIQMLLTVGSESLETNSCPKALKAWANRAAIVNAEMADYRTSVLAALTEEGHQIIAAESLQKNEEKQTKTEVNNCREKIYNSYCDRIVQAEDIDEKKYRILQQKRQKSERERQQYRKAQLKYRYQISVTPELVKEDDRGLYAALLLRYYLTVGYQFLFAHTSRLLDDLLTSGEIQVFPPDFNQTLLLGKVQFLRKINLSAVLAPNRELRNSDADLIQLTQLVKAFAVEVRDLLGVSINSNASPIQVVRQLLAKLGLKLTVKRREGGWGKPIRVYQVAPPSKISQEVINCWLSRDMETKAFVR